MDVLDTPLKLTIWSGISATDPTEKVDSNPVKVTLADPNPIIVPREKSACNPVKAAASLGTITLP